MKVVVLKYGMQDELGRVFNDDVKIELFTSEEKAQERALEIGKEFVPDAKNTEELAEGLINLDDKGIANMNFDIDTIEVQ